jgi:hypothetical protein
MPPVGIEPAIPTYGRLQTYALDRATTIYIFARTHTHTQSTVYFKILNPLSFIIIFSTRFGLCKRL